jgi:hypothetical protein
MRAPNMQSLTDDSEERHPGIVIYGKGDKAHEATSSNHNEDDTPGVRTPQTDSDSIREHRAIDLMIGPAFTKAQADQYVEDLLSDPKARQRLVEIIWNRHIWTKARDWVQRDYSGKDPHTNHVHVGGDADDDANASSWPTIRNGGNMPLNDQDRADIRKAVALGIYDIMHVAANHADFNGIKYTGTGSLGQAVEQNLGKIASAPAVAAVKALALQPVSAAEVAEALANNQNFVNAVAAIAGDVSKEVVAEAVKEVFRTGTDG